MATNQEWTNTGFGDPDDMPQEALTGEGGGFGDGPTVSTTTGDGSGGNGNAPSISTTTGDGQGSTGDAEDTPAQQPATTPTPQTVAGDQILDIQGAKDQISTVTPGAGYLDPATGTVAGQLDSILDRGGPLMTRAANFADTRSQALGGSMGGSMGIGAAQGAMINAAMPIAQQDASTYANIASMDKEFGMQRNIMETQNYWNQQIEQGSYDQATKMSLMAGSEALMEQFIATMGAAASSAEFSQAEADRLTQSFNDSMTNYFATANYDNLNFSV